MHGAGCCLSVNVLISKQTDDEYALGDWFVVDKAGVMSVFVSDNIYIMFRCSMACVGVLPCSVVHIVG